MNWKTFFICGLTGWCMEILFTSLGGLLRGDLLLNGHTSIWMFPIYGLAAVIGPQIKNVFQFMKRPPAKNTMHVGYAIIQQIYLKKIQNNYKIRVLWLIFQCL